MTPTLAWFLIPYTLLIVFYLFYSAFSIFHLIKFGIKGKKQVVIITLYLFVFLGLLTWSFLMLVTVDWSTPILLTNPFESNNFLL